MLHSMFLNCKRDTARIGVSALLAALLLTTVSAATLTLNVKNLSESRTEVARLTSVIRATSDTLESVRAAETGQRGFLLTGQERYLATYKDGLPRARSNLQSLYSLVHTGDDRELVEKLYALIDAKLSELSRTVGMARENQAEALRIVRNDTGQIIMEEIEAVARVIAERSNAALARSWAADGMQIKAATIIAALTGAWHSAAHCSGYSCWPVCASRSLASGQSARAQPKPSSSPR